MAYGNLTLKIAVKVKLNVTNMMPIYGFLLVSNTNYALILHFYQDITTNIGIW